MANHIPSNHSDSDPDSFLRLFGIITLVSMIVILTAATYGIYKVYARHVIAGAEEDSINISDALFEHEKEYLIATDTDATQQLSISSEDIPKLDKQLRSFLQYFDIVKIKIYNMEKQIIYCTDATIIGHVDAENARLQKALSGQTDAHLERKDMIRDLADEQVLDVDVVETYVPIRTDKNNIIGIFEVYIDVTKYRREIRNGVTTSIVLLAAILTVVFASAFIVMRKATTELRAAQKQLRQMATTDALTGLFNRGEIFAIARQEISRINRNSGDKSFGSLALIMIDIDKFKHINDTYGHQVGDAILRELATRFRVSIRKYDSIGRYGGEEFLVLLPGCGLIDAQSIAERTRKLVEDTPLVVGDLSIDITISLGISCMASGNENDLVTAIKLADDGLYKAKHEGRNRVGVAHTSQGHNGQTSAPR